MRLDSRLAKLEEELNASRKIYQVRYVASSEEARKLDEEREPAQPGDIRYIIVREPHAKPQKQTRQT